MKYYAASLIANSKLNMPGTKVCPIFHLFVVNRVGFRQRVSELLYTQLSLLL
jgi:hypothetical protein